MAEVRVLVVDDSPTFLTVVVRLLERDGLTVVGTATSSAEALARADDLHPEVALIDVHLGSESGLDLARRMVGDDRPRATPVILMSTHSEEELAPLVRQGPALGFVTKQALSGSEIRRLLEVPPG